MQLAMAALPPWKQALLDRKKKQEQEEEAKKIQAEEAKLATLPPWKRAILLREKQGKEGGTSSALASSQSQASGKKGPLSNKWQVAVERVKGPDSPILKKKPLSAGPTVTERWKPKDSPSSQNVSIRTTTPQATKANEGKNLSGLPAQKQALQTKDKQMRVSSTPASDEDVPAWKRALAKKEKKTTISLTASIPASSVEIPAWKQALEKKTTISSTTRPDDKLPAWKQTPGKKTTVSSTTPTPGPDDKVPAWKPTPGKKTAVSSTTSTGKDDANLSKIPAWKRALILKKQGRSIDGMEASSQRIVGEDESDSAELTVNIPTKTVEQQPVVMNRNEEENEVTSQRLVEQEGITLHPPVYKEVDEWANVKEEDEKFKDLPLWKQALIKRRRADIAKRSGLPVTTGSASSSLPSERKEKKSPTSNKSNGSLEKKLRKPGKKNPQSDSSSGNLGKHTSKVGKDDKLDFKPARKAPQPPSTKKPSSMFTYNFSKSTHHTLNTGDSSNDSTDSEMDEAIITNLDESSSDEGDSGIVLQRYSTTKQPDAKSIQEHTKSANSQSNLSKKPKKHLRRVSWSDTQLTSEHFYPKYDYSDYDDIDQENSSGSSKNANSGLSHRLHPSLRPNDSDPYGYGFTSPASPRSATADNSLSTFVPKALSTYTPQILSSYSQEVDVNNSTTGTLEEEVEDQTNDFYADLNSNTAALLW